jgi:hypothetical protein
VILHIVLLAEHSVCVAVQWLEFELTKVRSEYIKLRGNRGFGGGGTASGTSLSPGFLSKAGISGVASRAVKKTAPSEADIKRFEEEVLGPSSEDEDENGDEDDASIPPWAKEVSEDVDKHIREGRVPPIMIAKTRDMPEQEKFLFRSPTGRDSPERDDAGGMRGGGVRRPTDKLGDPSTSQIGGLTIFEKLADPDNFTGIHKHVTDEVSPAQLFREVSLASLIASRSTCLSQERGEKRKRVEQIKGKVEQVRTKFKQKPGPKGPLALRTPSHRPSISHVESGEEGLGGGGAAIEREGDSLSPPMTTASTGPAVGFMSPSGRR